jgi:hypothetical membrane protein
MFYKACVRLKLMKLAKAKLPSLGSILWVLSFQYFLVQIVVASNWLGSYSVSKNTISDLGNTGCGIYANKFVCSPLHLYMDISFVVLGITMIIGSFLIAKSYKKRQAKLGFAFMALAGIGTIIVGLFPENTITAAHIIGASLPFIFGNLAMIVFSFYLKKLGKSFRVYSFASGLLGLCALILFVSHTYLGLGIGGMERIVAYPQTIWLIAFGIRALMKTHDPKVDSKN